MDRDSVYMIVVGILSFLGGIVFGYQMITRPEPEFVFWYLFFAPAVLTLLGSFAFFDMKCYVVRPGPGLQKKKDPS